MVRIEAINEKSPYLKCVKRLWRANSDWLGFYPDGAFLDRARRNEIIVAIDDRVCCGYLLYYLKERRKVRLTHLCVEESYKGKGIGRRLVEFLRGRTRDYSGIGLYCRRDFPAWAAWPKLGFVALDEKQGRGKDDGELTYFWMANVQASLFHSPPLSNDERVEVVVDANVFYDLDDPTRSGAEESQGILADWLLPSIRLCVTDEVFNEIQRQQDRSERSKRLRAAKSFEALECDTEVFQSIELDVRDWIGDPKTTRDEADIRQVARTIASRAAIFVTRDQGLLGHAEAFYSKYGLSVVRPSELVGRFEELRNERAYQQERLVGTTISKSRLSRPDDRLATAFQDPKTGEKKRNLEQKLNTFLSAPERYNCFLISDSSKSPGERGLLAFYVVENTSEHVRTIPLFRLSASVRSTRTASTLFRTILAGIVEQACRTNKRVVKFEQPLADPSLCIHLEDAGFIPTDGAWAKLGLGTIETPRSTAQKILATLSEVKLTSEGLAEIADILTSESFGRDPLTAWEAEHILWPAKIIGSGIPCYIVPIKPGWAADLFDSGLANGRLWGADPELALNPESVYYRSARNSPFRPLGRVLWYISQGKNDPNTMRIRACSRLSDVIVGPAKDLYREFRRLGVYAWEDVLETAKGVPEGRIMALKFDDTERMPYPPKWDEFQEVLMRHGKRTNLQSPVEIPEAAFIELYKMGFSNETR